MKPSLQFVFNLFCFLLFAATAQAQTEDQVRDVQKIYKDAKAPGLEVTIYLQEKNGALTPVLPDREFHKGENVKIRIESNFSGYLYIVNHGASGNKSLIFPDGKESNQIQPGTTYLIPNSYDLELDENAGFETLQIIASPQRLSVLDAALKQPEGKLNSKQIAAVATYWTDSAPNKSGITSGSSPNQNQSVSSTFDKDKKKTTILSEDDSRGDPTFDQKKPPTPPPTQSKSGKRATPSLISVGIKLKNTGTPN